jgi:hypothetical protein
MSAVEASQLGVDVSLQQVTLNPRYLADFAAAKIELEKSLADPSATPERARLRRRTSANPAVHPRRSSVEDVCEEELAS